MNDNHQLKRFLDAQNQDYLKALSEIQNGRKISHWMWYVFPQIAGLGQSEMAKYYGISGLEEAAAYAAHPVLGKHLVAISTALLAIEEKTATDIFGQPDDLKLRSSMTLFANIPNAPAVFEQVLNRYFGGLQDELTLQKLLKDKLAVSNDS